MGLLEDVLAAVPWYEIYLIVGFIGCLGLVVLVYFIWNVDTWQAKLKNIWHPKRRYGIMRVVGRGGAIRRFVVNFNDAAQTVGDDTFILPNENKFILLENNLPTATFSFKDATKAIEYDPSQPNIFKCPECKAVVEYSLEKARQPTNLTSIFMLQKARAAAAEFLKQFKSMNLMLIIAAICGVIGVALLLLLVNNLNGVMATLHDLPVVIK